MVGRRRDLIRWKNIEDWGHDRRKHFFEKKRKNVDNQWQAKKEKNMKKNENESCRVTGNDACT